MSRNLFKPRLNVKPFEYPELIKFKEAIQHSYWLFSEFNYESDIQNYKVDCTPEEREVIKRCMLAISHIEVKVKDFWGNIHHYFPKPEIGFVGGTFLDSEIRHFDAYSNLLEVLGLNHEFDHIHLVEPLKRRTEYMMKVMERKEQSEEEFILSMVLFSLFIEHISLFSQFYIMMSFNKYKNTFKGISNAVEATSKEEEIHGKFGIELYRIAHVEHRELFTDNFYNRLKEIAAEAFEAEKGIVDWIYEAGDLPFCRKEVVIEYIKNRYNKAMETLGLPEPYIVSNELLKETEWFDIEVLAQKENDFFNKRSTDYSKRQKEITGDDLF